VNKSAHSIPLYRPSPKPHPYFVLSGLDVRKMKYLILISLAVYASYSAIAQCGDFDSITLTRTTCHGRCPAYTITIHSDGAVYYKGDHWVKIEGIKKARVKKHRFEKVLSFIREVDFINLDERYSDYNKGGFPGMGSSSEIITVRCKEHQHEVTNYGGGLEKLSELANLIDDAANSSRWVGGMKNRKF